MRCPKCNSQIDDDIKYCPYCGTEIDDIQKLERDPIYTQKIDAFFEDRGDYWKNSANPYWYANTKPQYAIQKEKLSSILLWCIFSFCVPLGGMVVAYCFRHTRPKTAKFCLILSLISYAINYYALWKGWISF